jgi:hypothetical protein
MQEETKQAERPLTPPSAASQPTERGSWRGQRFDRVKRLFTAPKLPAWAVILLLIIEYIPDWKSRYDFWLGVAKSLGGETGVAAALVASPFFNLALLTSAILWMIFVGEPKKGIQRHSSLTAIGWGMFGLSLTIIVLTVGAGAIEAYVQEEVSARDIRIQTQDITQPVFWHLTDYQRTALGIELDKIPKDQHFSIVIECLPDASSRTFTDDIAQPFLDRKWTVTGNCLFNNVRPDLVGLFIGISKFDLPPNPLPDNAKRLAKILTDAKINFQFARTGDNSLKKGDFILAVGNAP